MSNNMRIKTERKVSWKGYINDRHIKFLVKLLPDYFFSIKLSLAFNQIHCPLSGTIQ